MGKKIRAVLESDADCGQETIDQPMLDVPKNTTCPTLDGFESDSNSGNEAPNPGDEELLMGFMMRVHLQSPIPFSMMIPTPIFIHHQKRQNIPLHRMRIYAECICCPQKPNISLASSIDQCAFNNGEEDPGRVGIRRRLRGRNHRPTHARRPQHLTFLL